MKKIDLITGFLGSGKTTFIRKYVSYLCSKGERVCILENDYGAVNVDMMLLKDLCSDMLDIEMVAGGCDRDCHRRRFKTKLIAMGMKNYDRIIVEPSGLFDVDEFFDTLEEEPLDEWYETGNVIALVDAQTPVPMSLAAEKCLASEIADAGMVIFSKTQKTDGEGVQKLKDYLNDILLKYKTSAQVADNALTKDWDDLNDEDYERIRNSGYRRSDYIKFDVDEAGFSSLCFMNISKSAEDIASLIRILFDSTSYGRVYRVKGFARDNGSWKEINATADGAEIETISDGQDVVIVIGEDLKEKEIEKLFKPEEA